jgi:hypothetical protein
MTHVYPATTQIELMEPAELAIRAAMLAVDRMPAHSLLTEAIMDLERARQKIAEWRDTSPMTDDETAAIDKAWTQHTGAA